MRIFNLFFFALIIYLNIFDLHSQIVVDRSFKHLRIAQKYSFCTDSFFLWSNYGIKNAKDSFEFRQIFKPYLKHQSPFPGIIKIKIKNTDSAEVRCVLDINNVEIDQIRVAHFDENDSLLFSCDTLGDNFTFFKRIIPYRVFAIPFNLKANSEQVIYVSLFNKNRIITCYFDFDSEKFWQEKSRNSNLFHGIIIGLYICFVFLGLILFVVLRRKVYLFYSLYSLSVCLLIFTMRGYSFQFLFPNQLEIQSRFLLFVQIFGLLSLNLYAIEFLQLEKKIPTLEKFKKPIYIVFSLILVLICFEIGRKFDIENVLSPILFIIEGLNFLLLLLVGPVVFVKHKNISSLVFTISFSFVGLSLLYSTLSFVITDLPYILLMDSLSVTLFLEISILTVFMVYNYKNELQKIIELQREVYHKTKQNQVAFLEGQELEKKIIAQELHDGIASDILIAQTLLENDKLKDKNSVQIILKNVSQQMRGLSHSMFPEVLNELGLVQGLNSLFSLLKNEIKTHLYFNQNDFPISKTQEIQIYRIAQELLKNTLKHANANNIYFQLLKHEDEIVIEYEDDGNGFNLKAHKTGIGIKSIYLRAESLNASVHFESQYQKGMYFTMKIPLIEK
ncbi:MAG: 7TM diverse intracellular signaling domain-containing protein [Bacteroidota bacterium]